MNWQETFAAIKGLSPASLEMREPGDWYVSQNCVSIENGSNFSSHRYGNGINPEAAVHDHWNGLTDLKTGEYIKTQKGNFRWNGFMWDRHD